MLALLSFIHATMLLAVAQQRFSSRITESRGRNICYDRFTGVPRCCDGYTSAGGGTWNCDNPLCRRGCGDGRCISPNLCACPDGRRASTCPETPSCTNGCRNGGTCIGRNRCRCPAAFAGDLCETDNCPNGCLNGGLCVGKNRCLCPNSVTGARCETDNRVGPCYREIRASRNQKLCANVVPDVFCSRCLCCQTVGVAWGRPCQKCPQVDAEKGRCVEFQPTNDTYMDSATLQHGDRQLLIVGNSSLPGDRKRTLLKYNVSSVKQCSLIREVHLNTPVNSTKSLRQANNITAHLVRSAWEESTVSSRYRTSDDEWVEPFLGPANQPPNGVDAEERAQGSATVTQLSISRRNTPKIKILTKTVCDWIANPRSGNNGLLLRTTCENSSCGEIRFNSKESRLPAPTLEVCLIDRSWKDNDCLIHICPRGSRLNPNTRFCEDIDECEKMPNICGKGRGKCINTDGSYECQCVRGFTKDESGACTPPELGYCYRQITHHRCSQLLSRRVSKSLCCNLVGEGWGMETCSHIHECVEGDRGDGQCSAGFYLNSLDNCEDINECEIFPTICQPYGRCLNTHGGFRCHCNVRGFRPDSTGTRCVDTRPGQCWGRISNGRCEYALGTTSLAQCCCSVGKSWGNPCQLCPARDTAEFDTLCYGGVGFIGLEGERDIDECTEIPGMCRHGYCVNTFGSYQCHCPDGYTMDATRTTCVDKNECVENRQLCGRFGRCVNRLGTYECHCSKGYRKLSYHTCIDIDECRLNWHNCRDKCVNVPGGFRCACAKGFFLMPDGLQCRDVNECVQEGTCDNGRCYNTPGSFRCQCDRGFRLTSNRRSCRDINECAERPRICLPRGSCFNTQGAYKCVCDDGYKMNKISNKCQDVNECLEYCQKGKCENYFGSFQCTCPDARYVLNPNSTECDDFDECEANPSLCTGGTCVNVEGSYNCACPKGYKVFNDTCVDVDECEIEGFCRHGLCNNTIGNFSCVCPVGHQFNENSGVCIDTRADLCYLAFAEPIPADDASGFAVDLESSESDICALSLNATVRRDECCCSLGIAWGRDCLRCPQNGTEEYRSLCGSVHSGHSRHIIKGEYVDINECLIIPGLCHNGYCFNTNGSYRCFCDRGYEMDEFGYQCVDRNECELEEVCGEGVCVNTPGSFNCSCPDGYLLDSSGIFCFEIREANCHLTVSNNVSCSNTLAGYFTKTQCCCSAAAPQGYGTDDCSQCPRVGTDEHRRLCAKGTGIGCTATGTCTDIDECAQDHSPCIGGICINTSPSFRCVCSTGYELDITRHRCVDTDECLTNPCNANADCVNLEGAYRCYCPRGFKESTDGSHCVDEDECALPHICSNGTCHNEVGAYSCTCNVGFTLSYTRRRCDDIDECALGQDTCPGVCTNTIGSYTCVCPDGTRTSSDGTSCDDIDECAETRRVCGNGNCANVYGTFHCYCPNGYQLDRTGRNCENVDECSTGRHDCRYSCRDTSGSYVCGCPEGYTLSGVNCLDINECYRDPGACGDFSRCVNTPGSYRCECLRGFQKTNDSDECTDVNECDKKGDAAVCKNGICVNRLGAYRCYCRSGWDLYRNICYDRNCTNNTLLCPSIVGRCVNHVCKCNTGYRYDRISGACIDINECMDTEIPCPGACQNTAGSYRCPCPPGFVLSGNTCLEQPSTPCVPGDCVYDCIINPDSVPLNGICGCKINEIPEKHRNYTLCVPTACLTGDCSRRRRSVSDELDEHEVFVRGYQPAGSCFISLEPAMKKHHQQIEMQIVDEFSPQLFYLQEKAGVWSLCLHDDLTSGSMHEVHLQGFYLHRRPAYNGKKTGEQPAGQMMNMKIHVMS